MLKNFLKDNLDSKNPDTRLAAIRNLDVSTTDSQARLARIVHEDKNLAVRLEAIGRLTDLVQLTKIIDHSGPTSDDEHSQQILEATNSSLSAVLESAELDSEQLKSLLADGSESLILSTACHASDEDRRNECVAKLSTQQQLAKVVHLSRYHSTRLLAAERLTDDSLISDSLGKIRSKDKIVTRVLQEKLNEKAAREKQEAAREQEISQTVAGLENLAASVWAPGYQGRFTALKQRWDQITPSPSTAQIEQYRKFADRCTATQQEHEKQQEVMGYCADAAAQLGQMIEELKTTSMDMLEEKSRVMRQRVVDANGVWRISFDVVKPEAVVIEEYELFGRKMNALLGAADELKAARKSLPDDIEKELNQAEKAVSTIESTLAKFEPIKIESNEDSEKIKKTFEYQFLTDAEALRVLVSARIKQQRNIDNDRIKAVQKQLGALGAAVADGKWSLANSLHLKISKKINQLSSNPSHQSLADKLSRHKLKLDELADWQDFAAKPKLEALCEKMEKLVEEDISPDLKARQLKQLQQEWKALGPSRIAVELWSRFKEASDKAYEPVGEFVKQKQTQRDEKLSNKKGICNRLETSFQEIDWESPDWKLIEKNLRQAKNDWKKNRITDRKPDRKLEERFTKVVTQYNEKLNAEYDANALIKQDLIDKVTKLAEADVSQHTINQTRRLQNSWKQTGIMRRKQDQELWETFNGHCREIHKKYGALKKEKADSGLEHVRRAREIIKTIKTLCQRDNADEKQFQALQEEFNGLAEFPERDKRGLVKDFNRTSQQFSQLREKAAKNLAKAEIDELVRLSQVCERYEELLGQGEPSESTLDTLNAEWESSEVVISRKWMSDITKRRDAAAKHLSKGTDYDYAETEKNRRLVCIKMEILAGKDTPEEDRSLRMEYQLANLQQGLGSAAVKDTTAEKQGLMIDWLCMPPASQIQKDKLESRFQSCL